MPDYKDFRIGELFDITTGSLLKIKEIPDGPVPRISVRSDNNGILGYFDTDGNRRQPGRPACRELHFREFLWQRVLSSVPGEPGNESSLSEAEGPGTDGAARFISDGGAE